MGYRHAIRSTAMLAAILLGGCGGASGGGSDGHRGAMELKIYPVPNGQANRIAATLDQVMNKPADASAPTPDRLLVSAPKSMQASVRGAIAELVKASASRPAPTQYRVQFWLVDALAGKGADDPALKPLDGSFVALRHAFGPLHFHLDQSVSAVTISDRDAVVDVRGDARRQRHFHVKIGAVEHGEVGLALDYVAPGRSLRTHIGTRLGQYVVLSHVSVACPAESGQKTSPCSAHDAMRLLVIRVDRLTAAH